MILAAIKRMGLVIWSITEQSGGRYVSNRGRMDFR